MSDFSKLLSANFALFHIAYTISSYNLISIKIGREGLEWKSREEIRDGENEGRGKGGMEEV